MKIFIDGKHLINRSGFHKEFKEKMGFPDFYGGNMDAWIDCMSYIDSKKAGTSKIVVNEGDSLIIEIKNSKFLKQKNREIYNDLIECKEIVNERFKKINSVTKLELVFK
jgi:RNAse (barnase) inhibitor barstar